MPKNTRTGGRSKTISRSAKTGRFVKQSYAERHPATTVVESVEVERHTVKVARNSETGRFVKRKALKGTSKKVVPDEIER